MFPTLPQSLLVCFFSVTSTILVSLQDGYTKELLFIIYNPITKKDVEATYMNIKATYDRTTH